MDGFVVLSLLVLPGGEAVVVGARAERGEEGVVEEGGEERAEEGVVEGV